MLFNKETHRFLTNSSVKMCKLVFQENIVVYHILTGSLMSRLYKVKHKWAWQFLHIL